MFRPVLDRNVCDLVRTMHGTSGRLLKLLSLLQTRRDWPGTELARRLSRLAAHDPPRHRAPARPRLSRRRDDRPGGRLQPARRHRDAAAAARRRRGRRDRRRPAHRRRRVGHRDRGDRDPRAREARAGAAVAPAPARQRAAVRHLDAARERADRRPRGADDDRRRVPRPRAAALRLPRARRDRSRERLVEPHSLVNLGRRWYLVAWDCDRDDWRTFRVDRIERASPAGGALRAAHAARRRGRRRLRRREPPPGPQPL